MLGLKLSLSNGDDFSAVHTWSWKVLLKTKRKKLHVRNKEKSIAFILCQ